MTTSRYRRLNILITMLMVIAFFIETLVSRLYVWVNILLVCRIHLHHRIFSLKGEFWAYKTSLILPLLFIEVPVPSKESERSYICVLGVLTLPLSTVCQLDFGIVTTMLYISLILFV